MTPGALKAVLRERAEQFAGRRGFEIDYSHPSTVVFRRLSDNFAPASFERISRDEAWVARTRKAHPNAPKCLEMQSSNSSDALLMSVFCHPRIGRWKGVRDLLQVSSIVPTFGFEPRISLDKGYTDSSEIDMVVENVFVEAKLTEGDFKQKEPCIVERYTELRACFHEEYLLRRGNCINNYQVVRNLLAAMQHGKRHILICDERRPDLVRRYFETVACVRDVAIRRKCGVVFWQEIKAACGKELRDYLEEKYGM